MWGFDGRTPEDLVRELAQKYEKKSTIKNEFLKNSQALSAGYFMSTDRNFGCLKTTAESRKISKV